MDSEPNIFQEYWQRFCKPWSVIAFVLYLVVVIIGLSGLGPIFAMTYGITEPTKMGYVASNLSTYALALLVPAVITILLSFYKTPNKVSSTILLVALLVVSGFLLHFSNVHQSYSICTAVVLLIFSWFFWIIANHDNEYLNDKSFERQVKDDIKANHNKDNGWDGAAE